MEIENISFNEYINNIEYFRKLNFFTYEFIKKTKYDKEYLGNKKGAIDITKNKLYVFDLLPIKLNKKDIQTIKEYIINNDKLTYHLRKSYTLLINY